MGAAPSFGISVIPVILLIFSLILNIILFKDDATGGAVQMTLFVLGLATAGLGVFLYKIPYENIEKKIVETIGLAMQAMLILLAVGTLIGLWILSGIVPSMIYFGLKILSPSLFLPFACIACALIAVSTGSSWSTTGTIGIALIGIGQAMGIPSGMVAGAIISGAYFGDKMSPLSDTTNLAPAMAGTDVFTHIRHMAYSSGPAIVLALIGFSILGFSFDNTSFDSEKINAVLQTLSKHFNITLWLFLGPAIVIFAISRKIPALPAIVLGSVVGVFLALIFQQDLLSQLTGGDSSFGNIYILFTKVSYGGFSLETGHSMVDSLLNRGGMASMLNVVWLILMAMVFSGAFEGTGMLDVVAQRIVQMVSGPASLIGATLASCLVCNLAVCEQYLSIVVPGRMFRSSFERFGLSAKNLSRALEDSGTVTSVLVPWNTCGAYNAGVLGVPTLTYLPYCFFNILSPIVSAFLAGFNLTIEKKLNA